MLDLNITLIFQRCNFFLALFLLNVLLIRPIRDILAKRQKNIDDMTGEAEDFETKAEKSLADYDQALLKARQEASLARQDSRSQGVAEQQKIVSGAQKNAQGIIEDARRSMQAQADTVLATLRQQAGAISQKLAERLIHG